MMQSKADFIENFAQKTTPLQELTQNKTHFRWTPKHQKCFEQLLQDFKKDTLLRYFDMKKKIYIFTDALISGLGAILAQRDNYHNAKPIVTASRTTSQSGKGTHNLIWKQQQSTLNYDVLETILLEHQM